VVWSWLGGYREYVVHGKSLAAFNAHKPEVKMNNNNCKPSGSNITIDNSGRASIDNVSLTKMSIISSTAFSLKSFNLYIFPTEKCNFRCTYCYEDFSIGRMKPEIISAVKAFMDKRCADLDYFNISWFGGEPLIAKDIVLEISEYITELVNKYPQLSYEGDMTTNGYLLDYETATALVDVGIRVFQISLDGPAQVHDRSRIGANGSNTYEQIWHNLLEIRRSCLPISILLRVHFSPDTLQLLDPLIDDIKNEFIQDARFSVFFKPIERLGSHNDASIKIFSEAEKEAAIKLLQTKLFGDNITSSQNYSLPENPICYASRPNSLVIRANGDVGKCTVALYDERNHVASLQPDGTLSVLPDRLTPWLRGIKDLDLSALACPLVHLP
jgi:uncharacterized protein